MSRTAMALVVVGLLSLGNVVAGDVSQKTAEELRKRYSESRSEMERVRVCIEAIDAGLLRRGARIGDVDALFGSDLAKRIPTERQGTESGAVFFREQGPPPREGVPATIQGWHLGVRYDFTGQVIYYYLTNVTK